MTAVVVHSRDSLRNTIEAGPHVLITDEPASLGGTEAGPTPYDLVAGALGACTSMTMHIVAKRENIPLEAIEVTVENDRVHAKDCEDCFSKDGYIHRFSVVIRLTGNLTAAQRERMLAVAKRCPVNKMLVSEIRIDERLAD
jgi:putative redox protein